MMFDPETCEFLQKYNFNWNSLFKSGLSYKQMERKGDIIAKWTSAITNGFINVYLHYLLYRFFF